MSYDQWKTASPYDDEPDLVEEAEKWLDRNSKDQDSEDPLVSDHWWMIKGLVDLLEE